MIDSSVQGRSTVQGRHQQAETMGLLSCLCCAVVSGVAMDVYVHYASAIWLVSGRMFVACSAVVAVCAVSSFVVGYARRSSSWNLRRGWWVPVRRGIEILSLSVVYAATVFLCMYALLRVANGAVGIETLRSYLPACAACLAGVAGYVTFVQADLLNAKTIASLLPFFVVSGVATAGFTTDDPYWWRNNFSQLGDRTTFAARMFNSTLILAGICVVILSYFAVSELVTTYRMRLRWASDSAEVEIPRFWARTLCLAVLLTLSGICFAGVGMFRYTPHPILHNVFARGLSVPMGILMIALPWLAPQLSRAIYVVSDLIVAVIAAAGVHWLHGGNTLTNVEALACILFMGWFIVFSRQIAAMEADRVYAQLTATHPAAAAPESRLSPEK
ncbi:ABC transporter permease [Bifidobacterium simiarum]|uniref:ABC transporter permease n=1 Tax=Bifidobacterium simiarum TaxID=2045441 RepID=A0A2M9HDZ7_9BIFI|nr:ABC transporter permease [Bifidobacterium simiarum]PJM75039.1 ABC transporter permease [Bifidobacterium simiarum]